MWHCAVIHLSIYGSTVAIRRPVRRLPLQNSDGYAHQQRVLTAAATLFPSQFLFVVMDADDASHRRCADRSPSITHPVQDGAVLWRARRRPANTAPAGPRPRRRQVPVHRAHLQAASRRVAVGLQSGQSCGAALPPPHQHSSPQPYRKTEVLEPASPHERVQPLTADTVDAFLADVDHTLVLLTCVRAASRRQSPPQTRRTSTRSDRPCSSWPSSCATSRACASAKCTRACAGAAQCTQIDGTRNELRSDLLRDFPSLTLRRPGAAVRTFMRPGLGDGCSRSSSGAMRRRRGLPTSSRCGNVCARAPHLPSAGAQGRRRAVVIMCCGASIIPCGWYCCWRLRPGLGRSSSTTPRWGAG